MLIQPEVSKQANFCHLLLFMVFRFSTLIADNFPNANASKQKSRSFAGDEAKLKQQQKNSKFKWMKCLHNSSLKPLLWPLFIISTKLIENTQRKNWIFGWKWNCRAQRQKAERKNFFW
jgi:hypothetical protein